MSPEELKESLSEATQTLILVKKYISAKRKHIMKFFPDELYGIYTLNYVEKVILKDVMKRKKYEKKRHE